MSTRRDLIKSAALLPLAAQAKNAPAPARKGSRPIVIASHNGLEAVRKAYSILAAGGDPLDAVISGVNIVEDDPNDVTVGYGGIPNEEGGGQLDAPVMDGPPMKGRGGRGSGEHQEPVEGRPARDGAHEPRLPGRTRGAQVREGPRFSRREPADRALPEDLDVLEREALHARRLDRARRRGGEGSRH